MWYVPLYQDAAKQSAIVQVMPAMARPRLPTIAPISRVPTRHVAFVPPAGYAKWPMEPKPKSTHHHWAPPPGYRSWNQQPVGYQRAALAESPVPTVAPTVIPALNTVVALPSAYRYSAAKAVAYVTQKIGWKFVEQAGAVPMALAQIGMPWAPKTATALSLLKKMCNDVPAIDITINSQTHTITYDARL